MATNGEVVIHQAIAKTVRFDPLQDLSPIAMTTSTPFVWSANASSGISSLADLVAKAKANPGGLAYSSAGLGSSNHLATEQFAVATGIKLLHVPYRGGAPAVGAISAGDVPIGVVALSSAKPLADSGRAQLLAVTVSKRVRLLPDVPTVAETGVLPAFESTIWTGVFAPRGTPPAIVAKIEADVIEVLKNAAFDNRLQAVGADIVGAPGSEMATRIKSEIENMSKTAKEAGIVLTD
jgi:tripartite-type tricarboxylate transporter receptor subunit TctC